MKPRSSPAAKLATGLDPTPPILLFAAANTNFPLAFPIRALNTRSTSGKLIARGTSRSEVARAVKKQTLKELSADVWAIFGYHSDLAAANQQECRTLIITFAGDKVADLTLANGATATAIASNLNSVSSVKYPAKRW